jgi:hypothetical protein
MSDGQDMYLAEDSAREGKWTAFLLQVILPNQHSDIVCNTDFSIC